MIYAPTPVQLLDYVVQSNLIEDIRVDQGKPLFDDHLKAAKHVVREARHGRVAKPLSLHKMLFASESSTFPGEYRQIRVSVSGSVKMPAIDVRPAMEMLLERSKAVHRTRSSLTEKLLLNMHYEFERIHPFWDGNGRTGRLWLNALRLVAGYEWYTIEAADRQQYYQDIQLYEHKVGIRY